MGRLKGSKNKVYRRIGIICLYCKNIFYVTPCWSKRKYCSLKCCNSNKIGKKFPKISDALKGKKNPFYGKTHTNAFKRKHSIIMKNYWKKGVLKYIPSAKGLHYSEDFKKEISQRQQGKNNSFWKGGISTLHLLIRCTKEYEEWRNQIFIRDDFTCQECFKKGGKLEVHHKKKFSIILQEFLQQYSQFSPIEDKETLVRLAITYEPFWDLNNGQTLCEGCHGQTKIQSEISI